MSGNGLEVWVVDDDQSVRWVLEKALDQAGMSTRCFERARDHARVFPMRSWRTMVSTICAPTVYTGSNASTGSWKIIATLPPR